MAEIVVGDHVLALLARKVDKPHIDGERSEARFSPLLVDEVDHPLLVGTEPRGWARLGLRLRLRLRLRRWPRRRLR